MLHFESMVKAVKINWIKRYRNVDSNYCKIVSYFTGINLPISTIISCQLDNTLIACKDPFYQQMFEYWYSIYTKSSHSANEIYNQLLWYNKHILVNNKPVFYQTWWNKGIKSVHHIITKNGKFRTKIELENLFHFEIKQMDYNSLTHAIPIAWLRLIVANNVTADLTNDLRLKVDNILYTIQNVRCKLVYSYFVSKMIEAPTAVRKWSEIFFIDKDVWKNIFTLSFEICEETLLQTFQYKIINRFFPCNYTLSIWYKDLSNKCEHCPSEEIDTIQHYFCHCQPVNDFWFSFIRWWKNVYEFNFMLSVEEIIFGVLNPNNDSNIDVLNYCILIGKYYIYYTKKSGARIFLFNFLHMLKNKLQILHTMYCLKERESVFEKKWSTLYENV